ncbi:MAG: endonuclease MutS2 [Treponema sp.]|jgi:DNA mismatch repair protein MutS2|nr:endonuclease MutS2 [Treponema sp.]
MNEKTLNLLEFDAIRRRVASYALCEEAAERINHDIPQRDYQQYRDVQTLVRAVFEQSQAEKESREEIPSIKAVLPLLTVEGAVLAQEELYAIGIFIQRSRTMLNFFARNPVLEGLCTDIPDCSEVSTAIFRVLDHEGKLRDLPQFRDIQRRIQYLNKELAITVASFSRQEETRKMLQSTVPVQRDGRTVLALKAQFRGRIAGIIHEVSTTGQTVFLEPTEAVEKNNAITVEQSRLNAEIHKVFRELTAQISAQSDSLSIVHERTVVLDTLRARARYSLETNGIFVQHTDSIDLRQARHPLLTHAVPIDFALDPPLKGAIITGPNTGGKTVLLKTIGLFALMNQFGLGIPAQEGSALRFFEGIFADIGDEQSLSQSLSTFSAHMSTIASILTAATKESLILLDELGAGTDPEEGSALAMAILDYVLKKESHLIVTTHHGALKNYGATHEGVENASVEFDPHTLSPTYRIVIGIPGESHALDIALRNGLDPPLVRQAQSYLSEGRGDVSALIQELKEKQRMVNEQLKSHQYAEKELHDKQRKADLRALQLRQKEAELNGVGISRLEALLSESRKTLENLIRELKEGEITREKTVKAKAFLRHLEERTEEEKELQQETDKQVAATVQAVQETEELTVDTPIQIGTPVFAGASRARGIVVRRAKKDRWTVEIGSITMDFPESVLCPRQPDKAVPVSVTTDLSPQTKVYAELNLLGMHLAEALETLERQIDAALISGVRSFAVIHGTGEGILQRGIHKYLSEQHTVIDFHFSRPELGGFGRTEVTLH